MKYILRHGPLISAPPEKLIKKETYINKNEVLEKAIFLLENKKYLYILYNGLVDNPNTGITNIVECDILEELLEIFYDNKEKD